MELVLETDSLESHSYGLSLEPTLKGAKERPYLNYIDSVSIAAGTIRRALRCMIIPIEDGRIIFHIDATSMVQRLDLLFDQGHLKEHETATPSPEAAYAYHDRFCESLLCPIQAYPTLGAEVAPTTGLEQSLLLRYSHALLEDYCRLVYPLQTGYARPKEGLSDRRRTPLTIPMLAEITRDACFYQEVNDRVIELTGAVDTLVDSLKVLLLDATHFRDFQSLAVELQSTCTDLKRTMITMSSTLEDHLRLFEISRGMHEAQSVRLLSILASIFLPLSLACGVLSMQTRFADLHYLLYDFFGVLILLGTGVILILIMLKLYLWWKELSTQLQRNPMFRKFIRPTGRVAVFWLLLLGWALLLSSFLVGMIKDVGLGLQILGYGVSAAAGIGLLTLICLACVVIVIWLFTLL